MLDGVTRFLVGRLWYPTVSRRLVLGAGLRGPLVSPQIGRATSATTSRRGIRCSTRIGDEAQWCLFDPILSAYYGRRFLRSRSVGNRSGRRSPSTERSRRLRRSWRCPELIASTMVVRCGPRMCRCSGHRPTWSWRLRDARDARHRRVSRMADEAPSPHCAWPLRRCPLPTPVDGIGALIAKPTAGLRITPSRCASADPSRLIPKHGDLAPLAASRWGPVVAGEPKPTCPSDRGASSADP